MWCRPARGWSAAGNARTERAGRVQDAVAAHVVTAFRSDVVGRLLDPINRRAVVVAARAQ
jgi:hypothetical protein